MKSAFVFLVDPFHQTKPSLQKNITQKLEEMARWDLPLDDSLLIKQKLIEWLTFSKEFEKVETPSSLAEITTDFERGFNAQGIPTLRAAYKVFSI